MNLMLVNYSPHYSGQSTSQTQCSSERHPLYHCQIFTVFWGGREFIVWKTWEKIIFVFMIKDATISCIQWKQCLTSQHDANEMCRWNHKCFSAIFILFILCIQINIFHIKYSSIFQNTTRECKLQKRGKNSWQETKYQCINPWLPFYG